MADRVKVGGLWVKKSAKGEFWSGTIDIKKLAAEATAAGQDTEKVRVVLFPNGFKSQDGGNSPDVNIFFNDWKPTPK